MRVKLFKIRISNYVEDIEYSYLVDLRDLWEYHNKFYLFLGIGHPYQFYLVVQSCYYIRSFSLLFYVIEASH